MCACVSLAISPDPSPQLHHWVNCLEVGFSTKRDEPAPPVSTKPSSDTVPILHTSGFHRLPARQTDVVDTWRSLACARCSVSIRMFQASGSNTLPAGLQQGSGEAQTLPTGAIKRCSAPPEPSLCWSRNILTNFCTLSEKCRKGQLFHSWLLTTETKSERNFGNHFELKHCQQCVRHSGNVLTHLDNFASLQNCQQFLSVHEFVETL